jgi:hypothetical protein
MDRRIVEDLEMWQDGEMERWRDGEMERWTDGQMEIQCFLFPYVCPLISLSLCLSTSKSLNFLSLQIANSLSLNLSNFSVRLSVSWQIDINEIVMAPV